MTGLRLVVLLCVAAMLGGCAAGAGVSPPASPSPIALPNGFPVGTWTVTLTEADLRAAGLTNPGEISENTGTFTRTIRPDGTWTIVQTAPGPVRTPIFEGTYRPTGDDTWEETTTFPAPYAGDVVGFRWAMEGDALRITVLDPPDPVLPILTETHAWQRT